MGVIRNPNRLPPGSGVIKKGGGRVAPRVPWETLEKIAIDALEGNNCRSSRRGLTDTYRRGAMMILVGIYTGYRNCDIKGMSLESIMLETEDLIREAARGGQMYVFDIIESKTQKRRRLKMSPVLMELLQGYALLPNDEKVKFWRRRSSTESPSGREELSYNGMRCSFNLVMRDFAPPEVLALRPTFHTLRKAFALEVYESMVEDLKGTPHDASLAMEALCKMLNHSDPSVTRRYLGITDEIGHDAVLKLGWRNRFKYNLQQSQSQSDSL